MATLPVKNSPIWENTDTLIEIYFTTITKQPYWLDPDDVKEAFWFAYEQLKEKYKNSETWEYTDNAVFAMFYRYTQNKAISYLRERQKIRKAEAGFARMYDELPTHFHGLLLETAMEIVMKLLSRHSPAPARMIKSFLLGQDIDDICATYGITRRTFTQYLSKFRRLLIAFVERRALDL